MGIATSLGLVINLLAWPVIALVCPLFASIRAVENDSKIQMRKLVIYWTLFSLFSLFEFTFAKIIKWIPYWSSARLVVIFWLVGSQFKGACLAYHGLVRPLFLVKLKEEKLRKREAFLNVIENYIQEYGWEALGKLIASEHKSQKCISFQRNTKNIELEGGNSAATPKQLNEPNSAQRDTEMLEATHKSAATKTNVKENKCLETAPLKTTHREWSCDLCKVTKVSKSMLNAHLHGSKHKSNLESFNASLLDAIETGSSPLSISSAEVLNGTHVIANVKEMTTPEASAENECPETAPLNKTQQELTSDLSKVTTVSESTLNAHLQGGKHDSMIESSKAGLHGGAMDTGPSPSLQYEHSISYTEVLKGTHVIADVEEITTPEASAENKCPETTPLKKTQQEWTCDLCKVTTVSESTLNAHLQGRKHKSKLEPLKASLLGAMDTGLSPSVQHEQSVSAAWDLKGPYAAAEVNEIVPPPKEMAEKRRLEVPVLEKAQQEWTCDLCKVTTTTEMTLNCHLLGRKHKSKQASKLRAEDKGSSPSATRYLNDVNVAEKLIREKSGSKGKLIASKSISSAEVLNGTHVIADVKEITTPEASAENEFPETAPLNKTQQERTSDLSKVTTVSESTLNAHLQGGKHDSMIESSKAGLHGGAMDTGPSPSSISSAEVLNGTHVIADVKEMTTPEASAENECPETVPLNKTQQERTSDLSKVTTVSESTLNAHLQGGKHDSMIESSKAGLHGGAMDTGPSPSFQYEHSISYTEVLKGTHVIADVEEITTPEASAENKCPETTPLKKTQQEWTCDLCKVTTVSESTLNAHLQGRKHKSKLEPLKASLLGAMDTGLSPSVQHEQSVSAAWDLKGPYAAAEVNEIVPPPKEMAEKRRLEVPVLEKAQQEWTCDLCKVTTTSEMTLNCHLLGRKHKSKQASKLRAEDKGSSPSATRYLNDVNVAEKLIREKSGSKGKLIASKNRHGECSNSHGDILVLESKEKYGPAASQQYTNSKVKESKPPKASCTQNPPPIKAPREWKCNICKVTTTGEKMLNAHLEGSKHKSKFESLKASYLVGGGIKDEEFPQQCILCKVKLLSDANVASHFEGKRHEFYMRLSQINGETGGYKNDT